MNPIDPLEILVKTSNLAELRQSNKNYSQDQLDLIYLYACYYNKIDIFKHFIHQVEEYTRMKGLVISKNKDIIFEIMKMGKYDLNLVEKCSRYNRRTTSQQLFFRFGRWLDKWHGHKIGHISVDINVYRHKEDYFRRLCKRYIMGYTWDMDFTILSELNSNFAKEKYKRLRKEATEKQNDIVKTMSLLFPKDISKVIVSFICL